MEISLVLFDVSEEREKLQKLGFTPEMASKMASSGYRVHAMANFDGDSYPVVFDTFYGLKMASGLLSPKMLLSGDGPKIRTPEYVVSSLADIQRVLAEPFNARFREWMSFRGQTGDYSTERPFPNPLRAIDGKERIILPGFWRKFRDNWIKRFECQQYESIFTTMLGDDLVYYGIPEWKSLGTRNAERYGIHTMSDLEDFPDPESKAYGRRWRLHKVMGGMRPDQAIVEQHYGIDTCGLDVTFDPAVAAFFAANRFVDEGNRIAHFDAISTGDHRGLIYCFVFRDPKLTQTADMVRDLPLFEHIVPTRPARQSCALPFFHAFNINEAVTDLHMVLRLSEDFSSEDVPSAADLFPSPEQDPFYKAVLELKEQHLARPVPWWGWDPYHDFVEYRV